MNVNSMDNEKTKEAKFDYIQKQMDICELPDRIKLLKLIIDTIGIDKVQPLADSTIINFNDLTTELINELWDYLKRSELENRIEFP